MMIKALHIFPVVTLVAWMKNNDRPKHTVEAFTVGARFGLCPSSHRGLEVQLLGSYLDSLSSGGSDDDASWDNNTGGAQPRKVISVNSYLDSLSKPRNEPTSYEDISYGQGGINPATWASNAAVNGYLDKIGVAQGGATPSPWDSGKSPAPWTPPTTPAKFAPVPSNDQTKKDQGLLFFADVLSSQQNQQKQQIRPQMPTTNANVQSWAIGEVPGRQQPTQNSQSDPPLYSGLDSNGPKYKSLYDEIEEEVGVIRPPSKQESALQQEAPIQVPRSTFIPPFNPIPDQTEPIVSVEAPQDPELYTSVPQPGEVVAPAPGPALRSSSGPPSWVVQATQETNSMPIQPIEEEEQQTAGPHFAGDQPSYADRAIPPDLGYSTRAPTSRRPQPPAPVMKKEEPVVLASQPDQVVVNYRKGATTVDDQQREIDDAFLRLAGALATSTRASGPKVGAVLVSIDGEILGEGGNEDAVLEAMQQSGFRFVPPRNGEGIGVSPPRTIDPRTMTLYTTSHPEDIRISKAIRNSCIGRVVVQGD